MRNHWSACDLTSGDRPPDPDRWLNLNLSWPCKPRSIIRRRVMKNEFVIRDNWYLGSVISSVRGFILPLLLTQGFEGFAFPIGSDRKCMCISVIFIMFFFFSSKRSDKDGLQNEIVGNVELKIESNIWFDFIVFHRNWKLVGYINRVSVRNKLLNCWIVEKRRSF